MNTTFRLRSPQNGTEYHIDVAVPEAAREADAWPVLLVLDGHDQFPIAVEAYAALRAAGTVQPLLLVGLGYGVSYRHPANRRGRDYTPSASDEEPDSGGADVFQSFVVEMLWPELTRRWPVHATVRGIAGHSVGALFVLHALFQSRPFFTHHLASAPSIWWDHRALLCAAARLREAQAELPARLFLAVGEQDSSSMHVDLELLTDQLTARPFTGLDVTRQVIRGRNHYDVLPDAFRSGIRALFASG